MRELSRDTPGSLPCLPIRGDIARVDRALLWAGRRHSTVATFRSCAASGMADRVEWPPQSLLHLPLARFHSAHPRARRNGRLPDVSGVSQEQWRTCGPVVNTIIARGSEPAGGLTQRFASVSHLALRPTWVGFLRRCRVRHARTPALISRPACFSRCCTATLAPATKPTSVPCVIVACRVPVLDKHHGGR